MRTHPLAFPFALTWGALRPKMSRAGLKKGATVNRPKMHKIGRIMPVLREEAAFNNPLMFMAQPCTYIRSVPNRLPPPFWQSLHLMEISVVFTALFAPACPTFTALRVRTVHPKQGAKPTGAGLGWFWRGFQISQQS